MIMNNLKRSIPKEGSAQTIIDRLYEYINPVDPNWIKNIKPASYEDIEKLKKICWIKDVDINIPKIYLEYLKYMGNDDGKLLSRIISGDRSIKRILKNYEYIISDGVVYDENDDFAENPYKFYIGFSILDVEYYLKFNKDKSYVITSDSNEYDGISPYSNDFEKLLFICAYINYEEKYYKNKIVLASTPNEYNKKLKELEIKNIFTILDDYFAKNNFKKTWFSDKYNLIIQQNDISFWINKRDVLRSHLYGNNPSEINKISVDLCEILGLKIINKNYK